MKETLKKFKNFITRDNIITMAIGVIMGSSFTAIVNSLVNDVFMPIIVAITGKNDVSNLVWKIGSSQIYIGKFLQACINFLIIAIFLFFIVEAVEKMQKQLEAITKKEQEEKEKEEAKVNEPSETELLTQILEELKKTNAN